MKRLFLLFLLPLCAHAQLVVTDPLHTLETIALKAGQQANHLEILRQWAEQLNKLNQQLRQLEEAVALQRRIKDVLGDPSAAGIGIVLRDLGAADLARTYGETLQAVYHLADAIASLRRTAEGIYEGLDDLTSMKRPVSRHERLYRRYAAVDVQAGNLAKVHDETETRIAALQADLSDTLTRIKSASTAAEVDKLAVKVAATNGQLALVSAYRRDEADKLRALQIQNENQAAKERQDLLEKQVAEERDSLAVAEAWQRGIKLTPTNFSAPVR